MCHRVAQRPAIGFLLDPRGSESGGTQRPPSCCTPTSSLHTVLSVRPAGSGASPEQGAGQLAAGLRGCGAAGPLAGGLAGLQGGELWFRGARGAQSDARAAPTFPPE